MWRLPSAVATAAQPPTSTNTDTFAAKLRMGHLRSGTISARARESWRGVLGSPGMLLDTLLGKRLLFLSGKGGVGKSVVGAALALAARDRGMRVLMVEIASPLEAARYFGASPSGPRETEVVPGLFTVNLDPAGVMEEYVRHVLKIEMLARRILESPIYHRFFAAAPGLKELMTLGKLLVLAEAHEGWSRRPRYDLIVVDAPATGHGLSLLKVPVAASEAVPVGPVGHQARRLLGLLRDKKKTGLVIVTVPEEMAVVEAVEFHRLATEEVGIQAQAVVLNACHERRFSEAEEAEVLRLAAVGASGRLERGIPLAGALRAARRQLRRAKLTRFYETRLKRSLPLPLASLSYLFREELGPADMRQLPELSADERFELVVLDTTPTRHALDFLEAPDRLVSFLDTRILRFFLKPYFEAGRLTLKVATRTGAMAFRLIDRFLGLQFLQDLSEFFLAFEGMYDGFKERAARVHALLRDPSSGFVLVAGPSSQALGEALYFHRRLREKAMPFVAQVVNRVHPDPAQDENGRRPGRAPRETRVDRDLGERLAEVFLDQQTLARVERRRIEDRKSTRLNSSH